MEVINMRRSVKKALISGYDRNTCCFDMTHLFEPKLGEENQDQQRIFFDFHVYWKIFLTTIHYITACMISKISQRRIDRFKTFAKYFMEVTSFFVSRFFIYGIKPLKNVICGIKNKENLKEIIKSEFIDIKQAVQEDFEYVYSFIQEPIPSFLPSLSPQSKRLVKKVIGIGTCFYQILFLCHMYCKTIWKFILIIEIL